MTLVDSPSSYSHSSRPVFGRSGAPVRSRHSDRRRLLTVDVDSARVRPPLVDAGLAAAILGAVALVGIAWIDTAPASWYGALRKPRFSDGAPLIIGLGWAAVCVTTAVAVWFVAQRDRRPRELAGALVACVAQLALLLAWVWTFFVGQAIARSLVMTVVLIVSSTLTVTAFGRISRIAGALMVPALGWAVAASALSAGLLLVR